MDFDFTDDQESLRDAVRRWVDKGFGFERRPELRLQSHAGAVARDGKGALFHHQECPLALEPEI